MFEPLLGSPARPGANQADDDELARDVTTCWANRVSYTRPDLLPALFPHTPPLVSPACFFLILSPASMALSEQSWSAAAGGLSPQINSPTGLIDASQQAAALAAAAGNSRCSSSAGRASVDLGYLQHRLALAGGGAGGGGAGSNSLNRRSPAPMPCDVWSNTGSVDALSALPVGFEGLQQGGMQQSPFASPCSPMMLGGGALTASAAAYGAATPEPQDSSVLVSMALEAELAAVLGGLSTQDVSSFLYSPSAQQRMEPGGCAGMALSSPALTSMGSSSGDCVLSPAATTMSLSGPLESVMLCPPGLLLMGEQCDKADGFCGRSSSSCSSMQAPMHNLQQETFLQHGAVAVQQGAPCRPRRHSFHIAPSSAQHAMYAGATVINSSGAMQGPYGGASPCPNGLVPPPPPPPPHAPPSGRSSFSSSGGSSRASVELYGRGGGAGCAHQRNMPDVAMQQGSRRRHSISFTSLAQSSGQGMPCVHEASAHPPESGAAAAAAASSAISGKSGGGSSSRSSSRQRSHAPAHDGKTHNHSNGAAADGRRKSVDVSCRSAAPAWADSFWHPLVDVIKSDDPCKKKGTGVFMPRTAPPPPPATPAPAKE